jgi:predicted RNase H-like HicB family nuclease
MTNTKFSVIVIKEENWYVAKCMENNVASQGKTVEEAICNLKEAVALYYEDEMPEVEETQVFLTTMEVAI